MLVVAEQVLASQKSYWWYYDVKCTSKLSRNCRFLRHHCRWLILLLRGTSTKSSSVQVSCTSSPVVAINTSRDGDGPMLGFDRRDGAFRRPTSPDPSRSSREYNESVDLWRSLGCIKSYERVTKGLPRLSIVVELNVPVY